MNNTPTNQNEVEAKANEQAATPRVKGNPNNPIIVGLDIGTTKVAAIAAIKNKFGKLEILGFGKTDSLGVDHGMVLNISHAIQSIERALEQVVKNNPDLHIKDVYVGIAGKHIKSLQQRGEIIRSNAEEIITRGDIEKLIQDQNKTYVPAGDQIIDIIPQDFMVDGYQSVNDPIGRMGVKFGANFHIITGDKSAIRNIYKSAEDAGLRVTDLVLQPLASAAAVMCVEELEAGVAIVDIGGGTTDLAVFHDGILKHTKVIPIAGVNITEDIRVGLGVLKAQAEQLKVQFGCALSSEAPKNQFITIPGIRNANHREISTKNLAHIIQVRMEEILERVMKELRDQKLDKLLNGGIILTGGGSQLKYLKQLTEFITMMPARIGYPVEHLSGNYNQALENPLYATCVGLVLRGFNDLEFGRRKAIDVQNALLSEEQNWDTTALNNEQELATEDIEAAKHETTIHTEAADVQENEPSTIDNFMSTSPEQKEKEANYLSMIVQRNGAAVAKRIESINKLFGNMRRNLIEMFEPLNDTDIDNEFK